MSSYFERILFQYERIIPNKIQNHTIKSRIFTLRICFKTNLYRDTMKKNVFYLAFFGVIIMALIIYFSIPDKTNDNSLSVAVSHGTFKIAVTTTGELEAKNSREIYGPSGLREFRIWQVKINDMVTDGTVVDSGQWVAELDRSDIINSKKDLETELEKLNSQHIKTRLDTSMTMRQAREDLVNLKYALEEQRIKLEQSKFEPPATIRQAKIELEKAERSLEQAQQNYTLKKEKAEADMSEVQASRDQQQRKYESLQKVLGSFTVKAPESGMVVYKRNWQGEKQGIGSTINTGWENVVAELPDLTSMISKTYVNEVDISKVKKDQEVLIGIDAFPDKSYKGVVESVANIGQQMKSSNAKVFEVVINLQENDTILRPAMTTKNEIITDIIEDVTYIPLEALHHTETISYVVTTDNRRHEVKLGKSNENEIIVVEGLTSNDAVYLVPPEGYEEFRLINLKN